MSELLKINVNDNTERKNGLTYLSWAWAWAEVLKIDPKARFEVRTFGESKIPACYIGDSAMVCVEVVIKDMVRECWLPVMDNRNKAIKNPDAFAINTAIMRCMTKAIGLHGLGLYIYAGEDLPESDEAPDRPTTDLKPVVIKPTDGAGRGMSPERKQFVQDMALHMIDCHRNGKDMDAIRLWYADDTGLDNDEKIYCWSLLATESKLRSTIKSNNPNKAAA